MQAGKVATSSIFNDGRSTMLSSKRLSVVSLFIGAVAAYLFATQTASAAIVGYSIDESTDRLYSINVSTGATTLIGSLGVSGDFESLGIDPTTGVLYSYADGGGSLYTINTTTGAATLVGGSNPFINSGMDFNAAGQGYLVGPNGLATFNKATGAISVLGGTGPAFSGLAFVGNTLYASPDNGSTNRIHTLNTVTGASTPLSGPLGIVSNAQTGLAYDAASDTLFMLNESTNSIYSINRATGAATLISTYNSGLTFEGLAIVPSANVPEPSTCIALTGLALGFGLIGYRRRKSV